MRNRRPLPWLEPGQPFPPPNTAWNHTDPAPGLLAAGGALDCDTLVRAYRQGIFPWFSHGDPILWWAPDPRMVLQVAEFKLSDSLRKEIKTALRRGNLEARFDSAFEQVITACANTPRAGQNGTWIVPDMVAAYSALHRAGHAHSVETWWNGELVGGLYCVKIGGMVFGESMFSHRSNASKIALSALVAFCRHHRIMAIDCQQNTRHLASLGAAEMPREAFTRMVNMALLQPAPTWTFEPLYWHAMLQMRTDATQPQP